MKSKPFPAEESRQMISERLNFPHTTARPSDALAELLRRVNTLQRSPQRVKQPVGIIGPGDGSKLVCDDAYAIATYLAQAGLGVVCGGRGGVMEAAARGATEAGGIAIGLLPENDDGKANSSLSLALPTGMGEMRNALIARCSLCLVAVGGGMGTLSEMAFGLKIGKQVFCMYAEFDLPGATAVQDVEDTLIRVLSWVLQESHT